MSIHIVLCYFLGAARGARRIPAFPSTPVLLPSLRDAEPTSTSPAWGRGGGRNPS